MKNQKLQILQQKAQNLQTTLESYDNKIKTIEQAKKPVEVKLQRLLAEIIGLERSIKKENAPVNVFKLKDGNFWKCRYIKEDDGRITILEKLEQVQK
jgi:prefoldin subunit 5